MGSLGEHIKTLRMHESSLAVNSTVLQYEAAKSRAIELRRCISVGFCDMVVCCFEELVILFVVQTSYIYINTLSIVLPFFHCLIK